MKSQSTYTGALKLNIIPKNKKKTSEHFNVCIISALTNIKKCFPDSNIYKEITNVSTKASNETGDYHK